MLREFRTQRITWDRASNHIHNQINANKGDSNGRKLQVQILNGGQTEDLGGSTLSLGWRTKSNSFKGLDVFEVVDSSVGLYEITFTSEMLYHVGSLTSSLVLITSNGRIESNPFSIHVISSTVDDETVQSENSFTALTQALVTVNQYDQKIEDLDSRTTAQLAQSATKAELVVEKNRIDNLATLEEGSTTGDAELADTRIGADGSAYSNAGSSVRGQVGKVSKVINEQGADLSEVVGKVYPNWQLGGVSPTGIPTKGVLTDMRMHSTIIPATLENDLAISVVDGAKYSVVFYGPSGHVSTFAYRTTPLSKAVIERNVTPEITYVIIVLSYSDDRVLTNGDINNLAAMMTIKRSYPQKIEKIEDKTNSLYGELGLKLINMTNSFNINLSAEVGSVVSLEPEKNASWSYAVEPCSAGDVFTINGVGGQNPRLWAFLDSENKLISKATPALSVVDLQLAAPQGSSKLIINNNGIAKSFEGTRTIRNIDKKVDDIRNSLAKPNGIATLDPNGKVLLDQIPSADNARKNMLKSVVLPAPTLNAGTGSPSLILENGGVTRVPYWSLSGTTSGQGVTGYVGGLGKADGIEVSLTTMGTSENISENDHEVFSLIVSPLVNDANVGSLNATGSPIISKTLMRRFAKKQVIESFMPLNTELPLFLLLKREIEDAVDTNNNNAGIVAIEVNPITLPKPTEIQPADAYNSWPFVVGLGNKLVCLYSKGNSHGTDLTRSIWRKFSLDNGENWSEEMMVIDFPNSDEAVVGKGHDSNGNILVWVRRGGVSNPSLHLYRSTNGDVFTLVTSPTFADTPYHIGDIIDVPSVGLMAFYNGGGFDGDEAIKTWGIVTSLDNGQTWTQKQIENSLDKSQWPTEISGAYIGEGKIIAIGRNELWEATTVRAMFQLQSDDHGATWTKKRTNITDTRISTGSMVYNQSDDSLSLYYFQRGQGVLRKRKTIASDVWDNPLDWEPSKPLAMGTQNISDTGNANATAFGDSQIVAYYSGDNAKTGVYAVVVKG